MWGLSGGNMESDLLDKKINSLILSPQYSLSQEEKEKIMLKIIKAQLGEMKNSNSNINSMYEKTRLNMDEIDSLEKVPFIPTQMFKKFDLRTVPKAEVAMVLKSSTTTGQTPSKVPLDKITARRQTKALSSTLRNYLGNKRRPFLVIDSESHNRKDFDLKARGAAIRGLSMFSKSMTYVLKENESGILEVDLNSLEKFCKENESKEVYIFGFTYLIWSKLISALENKELNAKFRSGKLFHSGGWKKIREQIEEKEFNKKISSIFHIPEKNVINFYGMVEQTGVIFLNCEMGYKHVPNFADIIIRDPFTLEEINGKRGIIEILSVLGNSYPSQAVLTEDTGRLIGINDCKCGRKGKYFIFDSRIEEAEIRGCGDTFTEGENKDG
jgi:hypothetical protein